MQQNKTLKVGFVVGIFPASSETFIIDQVADLIDRGVEVEIFSFRPGQSENISQRFYDYKMADRTHYLTLPSNKLARLVLALPKILRVLFISPLALMRALNFFKYKEDASSLKFLFWSEPFLGRHFDLYHCHFGIAADDFLVIRDIVGIKQKMITSFYGFDVSSIIRKHGPAVYDRLKNESSLFLVMSQNMKERIVAFGFDPGKVIVHPVSINVASYPFWERKSEAGQAINIVSVGRFVEKKGFDDLLRALAIVKKKTDKRFSCHIIGDGPLREEIYRLSDSLGLRNVVDFKGLMPIQKIIELFKNMHLFIQPSKTAESGDME